MKTIEKLSVIIDAVKEFPGINQKSISMITKLSPSNVCRLCKTLVKDGFLVETNRKYYTGKRFSEYARQSIEILEV